MYLVSIGQQCLVLGGVLSHYKAVIDAIDAIGSVEGIEAFIYCQSGDLVRCLRCLID